MKRFLNGSAWVAGEWISPEARTAIPIMNPATGEQISSCPQLNLEDVELAIAAAEKAFHQWKRVPAHQRADILWAWHDLILEHLEPLATLITLENGKPLAESRAEIRYSASFVRWFAEEARRVYGSEIPANTANQRLLVSQEPVGVCAMITPWNFPSAMLGRKVAAALAAGCTVVVKPSEETPLSAFALGRLAEDCGVPTGVINIVTGDPQSIGAHLCASPKISKISFTGSTRVGKILMKQSSTRLHRLSLELGGNAPFIVCEDADLEKAAVGLINSKFRNCGQTCIASNRILLHHAVHDEFLLRIVPRIQALTLGDGMKEGVELGPMINRKGVEKIQHLVSDALDKGAKLCFGVVPKSTSSSCFVQPMILSGVTSDMKLWNTEIFGPVVAIRSFQDDEEGLALANDTEYGLAAYIFTESQKRSWKYSSGLQFGMVGLNTGKISTAQAPFGGVKQSGFGREGSQYGLHEYLSYKYTCVDLSST